MSSPLKLYLAGPEVFLPDARAVLDSKAALTRTYGFEPICPGDLTIPPAPTKHQFGLNISEVDEGFMNRADGIIANLTPFRGIAADTGTSYELGFMCALGNGKALFSATDDSHGSELWVTDGTLAGTSLLKDINVGAGDSSISEITALGNGTAADMQAFAANNGFIQITSGKLNVM